MWERGNPSGLPYRLAYWEAKPLCVRIVYFTVLSSLGFVVLKLLHVRSSSSEPPRNIDLFFTSVSAATDSSMSTVEMEVFSDAQLVVMTLLMLVGGEVFISVLGLLLRWRRQCKQNEIEITESESQTELKHDEAVKYLAFTVIVYFITIHVAGSLSILTYINVVQSAGDVVRKKGIHLLTFSVFTTVSTFSNCGFVPTNENMIVFKKNSGLLLLIIPLVLLGNTLFPPSLRFTVMFFKSITRSRELEYTLKNTTDMGYRHLFPYKESISLCFTVLGFIFLQLVLFSTMEWSSKDLNGLNPYQKLVGATFMCVNSRHAGESIVDLSNLSAAVLVLFLIMMYLPPYTTFMPFHNQEDGESSSSMSMGFIRSLAVSNLACLAIFVILICITEKEKIKEDPLNFSLLNILVEVISAYGNVGFSTGYSCGRQLKKEETCRDFSYGFVSAWGDKGKLIIVFVMLYGRLKNFNIYGGKAWKLQ